MSRFTHEGTIRGADARTPKGYQFRSALRQTKRYWVTTHGFQFRKEDGFTPGNWGMYRLDLDSVTPCTHNNAKCQTREQRSALDVGRAALAALQRLENVGRDGDGNGDTTREGVR